MEAATTWYKQLGVPSRSGSTEIRALECAPTSVGAHSRGWVWGAHSISGVIASCRVCPPPLECAATSKKPRPLECAPALNHLSESLGWLTVVVCVLLGSDCFLTLFLSLTLSFDFLLPLSLSRARSLSRSLHPSLSVSLSLLLSLSLSLSIFSPTAAATDAVGAARAGLLCHHPRRDEESHIGDWSYDAAAASIRNISHCNCSLITPPQTPS